MLFTVFKAPPSIDYRENLTSYLTFINKKACKQLFTGFLIFVGPVGLEPTANGL